MRELFNSIQVKILTFILLLIVGVGIIVVSFVSGNQKLLVLHEIDRGIYLNSQTIFITLRNMMLSGEAPTLVRTMTELRDIKEFRDIRLFRINGVHAFSDYSTLDAVNNFQKRKFFKKTPRLADVTNDPEALPLDREHRARVLKAVASLLPAKYFSETSRIIDYYNPIDNEEQCMACHGSEHPIRGILHLKVSVAGAYRQIERTRNILLLFFMAVGTVLLLLLFFVVRNSIINPVIRIGKIVEAVGGGDFKARVSLRRRDEIGRLAEQINLMTKGLEERFILSRYVSDGTITAIRSESGESANRRKKLTVLFADLRGFTSYSEKNPPETVIYNLNKILEAEAETVKKHSGDIDKFVGDEIMALFENEASAVLCAFEMIRRVKEVDGDLNTGLRLGVGINSGVLITGNIGSKERKEYAAIGDTVNLSARLCALAGPDEILITESVYEEIKQVSETVRLEDQTVKGKSEAVKIFSVLGIKTG
jgi:adenylate cyclase